MNLCITETLPPTQQLVSTHDNCSSQSDHPRYCSLSPVARTSSLPQNPVRRSTQPSVCNPAPPIVHSSTTAVKNTPLSARPWKITSCDSSSSKQHCRDTFFTACRRVQQTLTVTGEKFDGSSIEDAGRRCQYSALCPPSLHAIAERSCCSRNQTLTIRGCRNSTEGQSDPWQQPRAVCYENTSSVHGKYRSID